jgi:hypothetical protein
MAIIVKNKEKYKNIKILKNIEIPIKNIINIQKQI